MLFFSGTQFCCDTPKNPQTKDAGVQTHTGQVHPLISAFAEVLLSVDPTGVEQ